MTSTCCTTCTFSRSPRGHCAAARHAALGRWRRTSVGCSRNTAKQFERGADAWMLQRPGRGGGGPEDAGPPWQAGRASAVQRLDPSTVQRPQPNPSLRQGATPYALARAPTGILLSYRHSMRYLSKLSTQQDIEGTGTAVSIRSE
eukprot:6204670-Pleurochrysis_carterae.AAC.3